MTIVSKTTFNGGEMAPSVSFRSDQPKYVTGVEIMRNALPLTQGPVIRRPGLEFTTASKDVGAVRLIPFVFNREQAYELEFGHNYIRILQNGQYVLDALDAVIEIMTTYTESEIFELHYAQSADVMFIAHQNHFPARLERRGATDWQLVNMIVGSTQDPPATPTASKTGGTGRDYGYVVTAVNDDTGEESIASDAVVIDANSVLNTDNAVTVKWDAVAGSTLYNVYKDREESGIYGYVGSAAPDDTDKCQIVDRGLVPSSDDHPPEARNPFDGAGNYPATVSFHEQRLVFAGTANKPQTVFLSQSANYNNYNVSTPAKDDDAVTITLASGLINRVVWAYGAKKLQVGTIGGEWSITGVDEGAITPDSRVAVNIGSLGSVNLRPIYINGMTMFVQSDGHTVRELRYDYVSDAYIPRDQIVYAEHLLNGRQIVDWAYQKSPYSVIWCVLDDGSFLGYSYNIEHEVAAWHRHDTDGLVESVCVVPYSTWDDVYFVVNRGGHRYIERMRPYSIDADVQDVFMVDSGVVVTGSGIEYVEGLHHIEGEEVALLLDGNVWPSEAVTNGRIDLPTKADKVILGLPFSSDVVPLPNENAPGSTGPATTLVDRTINAVRVYFYRSVGGEWGYPVRKTDGSIDLNNDHKMWEIIPRKGYQLNEPLPLFTGVKHLAMSGNSGPRGTILLRQTEPLPMNIFAMSMNVEMGVS